MSVDGVNNSNNAGLYAVSGAVLGAGTGVATGYLTKPFLKNGVPKDSFVKALGDNLLEEPKLLPEEERKNLKIIGPLLEKASNANTAEELNKVGAEMVEQMTSGKSLEEFQTLVTNGGGLSINLGIDTDVDAIQSVNNAKSLDEAKDIMKNSLKKEIEAKGFENVKAEIRANIKMLKEMGFPLSTKDIGKAVWEEAYDSANKKFVKDVVTEEAMDVIHKTMRSFQGKAAMMYGAIGAAVLGVAGFLCGNIGANKETSEAPQKVDEKA